jgi:hypothetical protein
MNDKGGWYWDEVLYSCETPYSGNYQIILMKIGILLLGAFLWAIPLKLFSVVEWESVLWWILMIISIFLGYLSIKGWDWYSDYKFDTIGFFIKFLVWMFILCVGIIGLGIGGAGLITMIPICYWTGKSVARWFI